MKVSEITLEVICSHIREYPENIDAQELILLQAIQKAAVRYCVNQTGMTERELDDYEEITIAVLNLIEDMWEKRSMTVQKSNVNYVADTIIGMHRTNLLPTPEGK